MSTTAETIGKLWEITSSQSLKDLNKFFEWWELSNDEYKKLYDSTKVSLDNLVTKVNSILSEISSRRSEFDDSFITAASNLKRSVAVMKDQFYSWYILTPAQHKEALWNNSTIDLWSLDIRSTWSDISLDSKELSQLKPERLLGRTNSWVEYYQVTLNGKTTILRYNSTDSWDEVALYELNDIDLLSKTNDDIKRLITNAERQTAFRDVEMDWTASARNILPGAWVWAWIWTVTTAIWWALPASMWGVLWWSAAWLAWAWAAMLSVPWVLVMWWSVIIWWIVSSMTDLDYTSDDYKKDFWSDMKNIWKKVASYKRK